MQIADALVSVLGFFLAGFLLIAVFHETGHVLIGLLLGRRLRHLRIGTPFSTGQLVLHFSGGGFVDLGYDELSRLGRVLVAAGGPLMSALVGTVLWVWVGHSAGMLALKIWAVLSATDVLAQMLVWPWPRWPESDGILLWGNLSRQPPLDAAPKSRRPGMTVAVTWNAACVVVLVALVWIVAPL